MTRGSSPTSSRKRVPPWACLTRPSWSLSAPVKAPFSYPKRVLSTRVFGNAVQSTTTKFLLALGEFSWMALAKSSLPVPVSPMMSTEASELAAWARMSKQLRMRGEEPMMPSHLRATAGLRALFSSRYWRARRKGSIISLMEEGFSI